MQVRFVQGDNISLSQNYQRDSCHLTICVCNASKEMRLRYFLGVFKRFAEKGFEPRVHWGKYFDLSGTSLGDILPDVGNFLEKRANLDPENIFLNTLLSQTLGIDV
jgi:L-gulonolactone oxidase